MSNNDSNAPSNKIPHENNWEKPIIKGYLNNTKTYTHAEELKKLQELEAIKALVEDLGDVLIRLIQHMQAKLND